MAESFIFVMMFALGGGNGGDLLDFANTMAYWHERRAFDVESMSAVLAEDETTAADNLMAIRALGEIGMAEDADPAEKAAILKVLTPLVQSKEPFVGQYAKRSIAWVKGEDPAPRPRPASKDIAKDLAILPHTSQIVGQIRMDNGVGPVDWDALLPGFDKGELLQQKHQMLGEINQGIGEVAKLIGNARVDAVTVGATFTGNGDDGYAVVVARGQYDRVAVQIALQDMAEQEGDDEWSFFSIGETEVITKGGRWNSFAILMPSNEQFIFMMGESDLGLKQYPIDETADLVNKGDAQLALKKKLMEQLEQIDREKAVAWVAMEVPAFFKNQGDISEVFGPFDVGHAFATLGEKGTIDVAWKAQGQDPAAIAETVTYLNKEINEGRAEMRRDMERMAQREPAMKALAEPIVKMIDSLHVESSGKTMTGGVQLPGNFGTIMPMMMFGMQAAPRGADFEADIAVEEVEDVAE